MKASVDDNYLPDMFILRSADDIFRNTLTRDGSSPFLGGSTTTTSDPTSHESGS